MAVTGGQLERAGRFLGAAEALQERMGTVIAPEYRTTHRETVTAVLSALGKEAFAATRDAGRALSLEQAIAEALEDEH